MTDIYQVEYIIRKNKKQTRLLRRKIRDWLCEFAPTHFISIQFPTWQRSNDMDVSRGLLKMVMKYFEKALSPRHWNRKPLLFIGFAERNSNRKWHFHLFLQNNRYTDDKIIAAINKTIKHFDYSSAVIDIKPIKKNTIRTYFYATKDIKANKNAHFDNSRILISTELFHKNLKHAISSQKSSVDNLNQDG